MKAKTITEIHTEAEKNLGLRPGATASIRNSRGLISAGQGNTSPGGFPIARPGLGGMMPGMPGARKMPGIGLDNDSWEVPKQWSIPKGDSLSLSAAGRGQSPLIGKSTSVNARLLPQGSGGLISGRTSALLQGSGPPARPSNFGFGTESPAQTPFSARPVPSASVPLVAEKPQAPTAGFNPEVLHKKTVSLLEEYFGILILDEALQCVEELKSPAYHPEVVKEAISLALEKSPPCIAPTVRLLEYLLSKKVLTVRDIGTGCLLYSALLDEFGIDLPKAPNNFGEIIGHLILIGGLDFKVVKEVLNKVEDNRFRIAIFEAGMRIVRESPSGRSMVEAQASDINACQSLL